MSNVQLTFENEFQKIALPVSAFTSNLERKISMKIIKFHKI